MKPSYRFKVGEQPCQNLIRGDANILALGEDNQMNLHQCPICDGNRTWCKNCHTDHHDGGWETCKPDAYVEIDNEDICGFCGQAGADKVPHPVRWPGEDSAGTELVHATCEDAECKRAHSLLSDKQRGDFLRSL